MGIKPVLRGVSHEVAAVGALPVVVLLVVAARSSAGRVAAGVYGACLVALFLVSAVYHRPAWSPRARTALGRLDHAVIFLFIAGTYTPLCLLVGAGAGHALLAVVWILAALGAVVVGLWDEAPKAARAILYACLGWAFLPTWPSLVTALGISSVTWLVGGGLVYSVGAVIFARRAPDPVPGWF